MKLLALRVGLSLDKHKRNLKDICYSKSWSLLTHSQTASYKAK